MARLEKSLKKLLSKCTTKGATPVGKTTGAVLECIAENYSIVLVSPDKSVWDIKIANDGTISGTKRA